MYVGLARGRGVPMLNAMRSWDPLYGRIEFTEYEYGLLKLAEVQRLRYVRMCNINSLLVTGASEISRFEHTIGVLHLTKLWCSAHRVADSVARDIVAAAVLHDMQTGPFGHSMQYVLEDNELDESFVHEDLSHGWKSTYHQEVMAGARFAGRQFGAPAYLGNSWENVAKIIKGEGKYGPLIAGTMDLDNIDNIVRLAFHVGITEKQDAAIAEMLARQIAPLDGGIYLPESAIPTVQRWQSIRRRLYELLLLDWAEFAAKAMLTRAIERAAAHEIIGAESWIRTDSEFLERLELDAVGPAQEVGDLIRRLRCADLYTPIYLGTSPTISTYGALNEIQSKQALEASLLRLSGIKGIRVLTHYILDKGKTERAVNITTEGGARVTIGRNSQQLLCGLFISGSPSGSERLSLARAYSELLSEFGVIDLQPLTDPMGEIPPSQQQLL
jgi:HD superfamily phosphohydrolase